MTKLTFSAFLRIVEDANQDVQKLMADITTLDAQIAQRTGPLLARKMALTKQLQQKQKQATQGQQQQQQGQPAMVSATTTPGSGGGATPGGAPPGM